MKRILICLITVLFAACAPQASKIHQTEKTINPVTIINYDLGIDAQLEGLARQVALQLGRNNCGRIGMKGFFDVKGRSRRFEKYIEIEFTNRLLRMGRFEIHTPQDLAQIEEITVPPSSSDGRPTNTDMIALDSYLIGSTIQLPQAVKVSVRIISAQTGSVFGTASVMIHKDKIVESLMDNFGMRKFASLGNPTFRIGEVIKTADNQYVDLIPGEYILYVKQINFEYALFTDSFSNVEIFLNEEFRVMKVNDMISITYDNERYILALRDVADRLAVFTFAHLNDCHSKTTENFSLENKLPYNEDDRRDERESETTTDKKDVEATDSVVPESPALEKKPENEEGVQESSALTEESVSKKEVPKI